MRSSPKPSVGHGLSDSIQATASLFVGTARLTRFGLVEETVRSAKKPTRFTGPIIAPNHDREHRAALVICSFVLLDGTRTHNAEPKRLSKTFVFVRGGHDHRLVDISHAIDDVVDPFAVGTPRA